MARHETSHIGIVDAADTVAEPIDMTEVRLGLKIWVLQYGVWTVGDHGGGKALVGERARA